MAAATGDVRTWVLALAFVAALDAAITRTPVLWGPTTFEATRDLSRQAFAQTYRAARAIYAPAPAARRVALLGNSRIYLAGRPPLVEDALAAHGNGPPRVENLAVFGAGLGDQEVLSRHLVRLEPDLTVVTMGTTDLLDTPALPLSSVPTRLLDVGFRDGPLPPADAAARVARWSRTVWPLFRFREFAAAAVAFRAAPEAGAAPPPDRFAGVPEILAYVHGGRAPAVTRAWDAWRREPTLARFVAYLEAAGGTHLDLVRARTRQTPSLDADAPGLRVLDALLARVSADGRRALVVLMPEHPLLAADAEGRFHRPGTSDAVAARVRAAAARHGVRVVDARDALPAEAFLDFDHPMPDVGGFHRLLAAEIARTLDA